MTPTRRITKREEFERQAALWLRLESNRWNNGQADVFDFTTGSRLIHSLLITDRLTVLMSAERADGTNYGASSL